MKASKEDEFLATIDSHKKIIFKVVNSYCRNKGERSDLQQEIIIQLWNSFDKYNPDYKYSTWMYRIALNAAISFYRKEKKWSVKNYSYSEELIYSTTEENEYDTALDLNIKRLHEFINDLNELNKALMLLYLEDKPYDEIADILGITKTNVATKISRLKLKLKREFQKTQIDGSC